MADFCQFYLSKMLIYAVREADLSLQRAALGEMMERNLSSARYTSYSAR
jgi:hypothetical protein